MRIVNISKLGDSLVVYFDSEQRRINAYTLASALVALADAAKAANADLNPGHEIEVVVEAIGGGSFKARIAAIYKDANNLFSKHVVLSIALSAVVTHFIDKALWPDKAPTIKILTDEVIMEDGDNQVVVPRNVYDANLRLKKLTPINDSIAKFAGALVQDPAIRGLSFTPDMKSKPDFVIPREALQVLAEDSADDSPEKLVEEHCKLQIIKAILEPGRRKWEFVWRGVRIAAPILDRDFYTRFTSHEITIAPGDVLNVRLIMRQKRNRNIDVYTTSAYEVAEVYEHIPENSVPKSKW